jgi:hypothetical protein
MSAFVPPPPQYPYTMQASSSWKGYKKRLHMALVGTGVCLRRTILIRNMERHPYTCYASETLTDLGAFDTPPQWGPHCSTLAPCIFMSLDEGLCPPPPLRINSTITDTTDMCFSLALACRLVVTSVAVPGIASMLVCHHFSIRTGSSWWPDPFKNEGHNIFHEADSSTSPYRLSPIRVRRAPGSFRAHLLIVG